MELAEEVGSAEDVVRLLVGQLEGMPIWGRPQTQINVVPQPSDASDDQSVAEVQLSLVQQRAVLVMPCAGSEVST